MAMLLMALPTVVHLAVQAIHTAGVLLVSVAFKLNGRVSNAIFLIQHRFECLQDQRTLARWEIGDGGVAGQGVHAAGNAPHV